MEHGQPIDPRNVRRYLVTAEGIRTEHGLFAAGDVVTGEMLGRGEAFLVESGAVWQGDFRLQDLDPPEWHSESRRRETGHEPGG